MPLSDNAANGLLSYLLKGTTYTPTTYVALLTAMPADPTVAGSALTETAYTSYARKSTAGSDWNAASGRVATNANAITFVAGTGGSDTVVGFALVDASSSGNMLGYGYIVNQQTITGGNITRSTNTVTVVLTAHGYSTGNLILISGCKQPEYNGWQVITVSDANTFTYIAGNSPTTPATADTGQTLQAAKAVSFVTGALIQPSFAAGALALAF